RRPRSSASASNAARTSCSSGSTRCRTPGSASSARPRRKMASVADRRVFWGTAAVVVVADLATKLLAEAWLAPTRPIRLVGDIVQLRLVFNQCAAVGLCVVVPETERLDRFLADQLALSRTVAARLIADKHVTRDGRPLRASVQLARGAVVSVELPPEEPPPRSYAPAHRDLTFAYEDEHLAVLDKPAGLVVHPGPGHWDDTLVNVLVERGPGLAEGEGAATEG